LSPQDRRVRPSQNERSEQLASGASTGRGRAGHAEPGVYVISVAAELAGMHPQTLRLYERRGLLEPARTAGGARRYSQKDIDRLHRISDLTEYGLNLAGIELVLRLQEETARLRAQVADLQSRLKRGNNAALPTSAGRRGGKPRQ
jgi:MerR family transcriptional regulator, heat shock protein HspR